MSTHGVDKEEIAISVKGVSKTFKLPHEKQSSIKGLFLNMFSGKKTYEKQQALSDISFDIKQGEFFGIVGRNGSGKSTMLKLISQIYTPDSGSISVNGKLTPFIELGVGFNPELSGRDNVFLNGALLGFERKEMEAMYDEIVEFAELARFMDQKLKNYSSGMQVRLAFSIAIKAKSDILVLDEVLAVGDEAFQQKCINVFERYKANKQTIVLVTHDMSVVERFCDRAIMLKDGNLVTLGKSSAVARIYSQENKDVYAKTQDAENAKVAKSHKFKIRPFNLKTGKEETRFMQGDMIGVRLSWDADGVKNVGVAIMKQSGEYIFGPNTIGTNIKIGNKREAVYEVELNLGAGQYYFKAGLFGDEPNDVISFIDEGPSIYIEQNKSNNWGGVTSLKHKWKV